MTSETLARSIVARLRAAGHQAYLVGGCVRDLLLGRAPKDFDVATDARPDRVSELFERSEQVGAHFGVVLVRENTSQVEVATFRSDASYSDGRRPDAVRFEGDPRQDAMRRDFTINALLLDPDTNEVLDFTGGREDLRRRVVRAIGDPDERFQEDHLRLIRAVRFAARLGFEIEPATMAALQRLHGLIVKVSPERVRDELARILTEGGARRGFELLDETGLLGDILPEVAAMKGVAQPPEFHPEGDVWPHTLLLLEKLRDPTVTLAAGALLHDVGKPPTFRVADRIRFDGHVEEGVRLAHGILTRLRFLERPDRADRSADRPPHALQGYRANAREHREAFPAHGKLRRAPGTTPPGLPVEQRKAGHLQTRAIAAGGAGRRGAPAQASADGARLDRTGLPARTVFREDAGRRGRCPT